MLTFFSNRHLDVRRQDSVGSYMDAWAWDLYMEERLLNEGEGPDSQNGDNCLCFSAKHPHINGISYGFENYDDRKKNVVLNMNKTSDVYFTPTFGTKDKTLWPDSVEHICSMAIDPLIEEEFSYGHFDYHLDIQDGSEVEESESDEDSLEESDE